MTCSVSLYFSCSATRSGISARHGPHQVAQKLTMTTLPRSDAGEISRPSRSVTVNAGAGFGIAEEPQRHRLGAAGAGVGGRASARTPACRCST